MSASSTHFSSLIGMATNVVTKSTVNSRFILIASTSESPFSWLPYNQPPETFGPLGSDSSLRVDDSRSVGIDGNSSHLKFRSAARMTYTDGKTKGPTNSAQLSTERRISTGWRRRTVSLPTFV